MAVPGSIWGSSGEPSSWGMQSDWRSAVGRGSSVDHLVGRYHCTLNSPIHMGEFWNAAARGVLQHSGYAVKAWSRRQAAKPVASCRRRSRRGRWLALWGWAGSCGCCRGQICRMGSPQGCLRCSIPDCPLPHKGSLRLVMEKPQCPQQSQ